MRFGSHWKWIFSAVALAALAPSASAQNIGYQLNRFEPAPAGDPFFTVEHPWYSSTRYFAAGLTLDYANNLLVAGVYNSQGNLNRTSSIIEHALTGHVDVAGSLFDRVAISASLPVLLLERGNSEDGISPLGSVAVGDPRLGIRARVFGQPEKEPISLSVGAYVWIPIGAAKNLLGDNGVRVMPRLMLGGVAGGLFRWTINGSYLYRDKAQISQQASGIGNTVGMEVQVGAGAELTFLKQTLSIGPEGVVAFAVAGGLPAKQSLTNFELLGGIHYIIADQVMVGAGAGGGLAGSPGPPDFRLLFQLAYAPIRPEAPPPAPPPPDRDHDGIIDAEDACPDEPGLPSRDPKKNGCPAPKDRDKDGVIDAEDVCPDVPMGEHPDPKRKGCPDRDSDGDGVLDSEDLCPDVPAGPHPDPARKGCPAKDTDNDGVYDYEDQCPNEKAGLNPDPNRKGCPLPDRDGDSVPDAVDACPDKPGAPDANPKKNGCPGLVEVKSDKIAILQEVYFDTDRAKIQPRSYKVLDAVIYVLKEHPELKVSVEGHTDNKGKSEKNMDLSVRRAASVMRYLGMHGIAESRLQSHGFGDTRPIADNKTAKGRQLNRRVMFQIVDDDAPKQ